MKIEGVNAARVLVVALSVWWGGGLNSGAADPALVAASERFRGLTGADLARSAAGWVSEAAENERPERVSLTVRAVQETQPEAMSNVVAGVARKCPDAAARVAGEALALRPAEAKVWASAAARAAPAEAGRIVAEMCRRMPSRFSEITMAASRTTPGGSHSILFELGEALPGLKPYLDRAKTLVSSGRATRPALTLVILQTVEILQNEPSDETRQWLPTAQATPSPPPAAGSGKQTKAKDVPGRN